MQDIITTHALDVLVYSLAVVSHRGEGGIILLSQARLSGRLNVDYLLPLSKVHVGDADNGNVNGKERKKSKPVVFEFTTTTK
jgi:hypothetical protein